MKPYATGDCETDPFYPGRVPKPFIWGHFDGSVYFETENIHEFLAYIYDRDEILYFHNGGKFDFHYLIPYIDGLTSLKVISGRVAEFKIGACTLRDSFCILPTGLAAFNKTEFDYDKLEAVNRKKHMPEIRAYLKSDCLNLFNYLAAFFDKYPRRLTLAGTALKVWRDMQGRVDKTDEKFYDTLAPFYFGGRCEVFQPGLHQGPLYLYDINSAYPRAMIEEHPAGNSIIVSSKFKPANAHRSFYEIQAESNGALPHREDNGSINFPQREGTFFCTGHELLTALETETAKIIKINKAYTFGETVNYKRYVKQFYALKLDAEKADDQTTRLFAKLFLNSLYGKMAANPSRYQEYKIGPFGSKPPEGYRPDNLIGNLQLFSKPLEDEQKRYYNLATAASITGWVRAYLWKSIQECSDVFYCDTDSIITTDHSPRLTLGDGLGAWNLESTFRNFAIAGKKLYAGKLVGGGTKVASKGVRLTYAEIVKVAKGETVTYNPTVPTYSIKTGIGFTGRKVKMTTGA